MPDGRAQSRECSGNQPAESASRLHVERVVEILDSERLDRQAAAGVERVEGNPVAQRMERGRERGRGGLLVFVHRLPVGTALAGRAGDVKQHEYGEIASAAQGLDVVVVALR